MATIGLKELNWDSQQGRPFSLPSQRNFPISFKPKVAIAEFFWKMQRETWYSILGVDAMPLSLKNLLLSAYVFSKNLILIHKNHFFANSIRFYCQSEVTVIFQVKTGLV